MPLISIIYCATDDPLFNRAGWGWVTPVLGYGERLRKHRSMMHKYFLSPELLSYTTIQRQNCHRFLRDVLETPEKYHKHAHRYNCSNTSYDIGSLSVPLSRLPAAVAMMNTYGHESMLSFIAVNYEPLLTLRVLQSRLQMIVTFSWGTSLSRLS